MLRDESLKIYIDRLKDGLTERINEAVHPSLICPDTSELKFEGPIQVSGEVYLADERLVCCLDVHAKVLLPCTVCNEEVSVNINLVKSYQVLEISSIKGAIFNLAELVREMILLEVPAFIECKGQCPAREEINKYLKKEESPKTGKGSPFDQLSSETFL
ncbi:MAG: hypothetical protein P4L16_06000 [Chlamydiales bacterium]|nr:hypothetical protein [Chlamydiales bacterium]